MGQTEETLKPKTLKSIYAAILPLLFIVTLSLAGIAGIRFFQNYQIHVTPKTQSVVKKIKFDRTPILQFNGVKYSILALSYNSKKRKKYVIIRNLKTNQILSVAQGERAFKGPVVQKIGNNSITLAEGSHTVVISLPYPRRVTLRKPNIL